MKTRMAVCLLLVALTSGCARYKPVLYPNDHYQTVGPQAAKEDIAECQQVAKAAGAREGEGRAGAVAGSTATGGAFGAAGGAVGGAVVGAAGRGSLIGAASGATWGLLGGLFRRPRPSPAYMNVVDRCLKEKGYEPMGWE